MICVVVLNSSCHIKLINILTNTGARSNMTDKLIVAYHCLIIYLRNIPAFIDKNNRYTSVKRFHEIQDIRRDFSNYYDSRRSFFMISYLSMMNCKFRRIHPLNREF